MRQKKLPNIPTILQMESLECGAAALAMILAYYGRYIPLEQYRVEMGIGRDGASARKMLEVARNHGLRCSGYQYDIETLENKDFFPCIIFWQGNHFMVLRGFRKGRAYVVDPAFGKMSMSMKEFEQGYTGICLRFCVTEQFQTGGKPESVARFALNGLKGSKSTIVFLMVASFLVSILGIVWAIAGSLFIDTLGGGRSKSWVMVFLGFMLLLLIFQIIVLTQYRVNVVRALGIMDVQGAAGFFHHIMHLPMEFFSQRMAGDLMSRLQSYQRIANVLVGSLIPAVINLAMLVFYLITMVYYNIPLAIVGVACAIINLFVVRMTSRKQMEISRIQQRDAGRVMAETMAGIRLVETIKSTGSEMGWFSRWTGYQAKLNNSMAESYHIEHKMTLAPKLLSMIANSLVLIFGLWFIMRGSFSMGVLVLFQSFFNSFQVPVIEIANCDAEVQIMRADMERVHDVMKYHEDRSFQNSLEREENERKLMGQITIKNLSFGYTKLMKPVVKNFDIEIPSGSCVAIVGGSGSGKSTISKLISGLYEPWEGEILYDGRPIENIPREIITSSIAVVDQDITLFHDSIFENIRMWDESIEDFEVVMAARDAHIHDDIVQREGGYDYVMLEDGKDFSGGQRQRLEIARTLAMDPTILILDEATSTLDAMTEYEVMKSIRARGITCIIIAHRLSTIRDCDEIIVMENGVAIERGKHEQLMEKDGVYAELVRLQ